MTNKVKKFWENIVLSSAHKYGRSKKKYSRTLMGFIPMALLLSKYYNLGLSENEVASVVEIIAISASGFTFVFGLLRKIYYWMQKMI